MEDLRLFLAQGISLPWAVLKTHSLQYTPSLQTRYFCIENWSVDKDHTLERAKISHINKDIKILLNPWQDAT